MIEDLDAEFANLARLTHPAQVRDEVKRITDTVDGDGGAAEDAHQHALNKVTLSATLEGRGILNGSLDAELSRLVDCAFDAEMYTLKLKETPAPGPTARRSPGSNVSPHPRPSRRRHHRGAAIPT